MRKKIKKPSWPLKAGLWTALGLNVFAYAETPPVQPVSAEQLQLQKDQQQYQAYIPQSFVLYKELKGDLNKDAKVDLVLIVKSTDPKMHEANQFGEQVDRNRRGIIVLLYDDGKYKKVMQNLAAFSSENEDGGVYFAPELVPSIEKGLLKIHYAHGRYGYWSYSFRLEGQDLRLIGYDDSSNHGPYIDNQTSINFLSQKKLYRDNINKNNDDAEPRFKESWRRIHAAPIYLSQIHDFDQLTLSALE